MDVLSIVSARPNFVKVAALHAAFRDADEIDHSIVHTGQHYDVSMNDVFFEELGIPDPSYHLGVGSGTQAEQIGQSMVALEPVLEQVDPDWVLVMGDTNGTVSGAITAKMQGFRLAHLEAGLRSFDWGMPEEINRVTTDRVSDLLLASEPSGVHNLRNESTPDERIAFVGNVMIDTLDRLSARLPESEVLAEQDVDAGEYGVVTLHRPSNVDEPDKLEAWMEVLEEISEGLPLVFPVHPRTREALDAVGYEGTADQLSLTEPVGYLTILALLKNARAVFTDSGGIQEETTALQVPCLTLRDTTERPATVLTGTNRIVGSDPDRLAEEWTAYRSALDGASRPPKWDSKAAPRVADELLNASTLPSRGIHR